MKKLVPILILVLIVLAGWAILRSYRDVDPGGDRRPGVEDILARERAAALFAQNDLAGARAAMAPLVSGQDASLEDLVRAAAIEFADRGSGAAPGLFERIRALDLDHPALHYMLARGSLEEGDFEGAVEHYRAVLRRAPSDLPGRVGLATTLADLEQADEAQQLLREVLALGVDQAGLWYVQAVQRMLRIATLEGREADAQHYSDLFVQLQQLGYRAAAPEELDKGTLAIVRPPTPQGSEAIAPGELPRLVHEEPVLPEMVGVRELAVLDVDGDGDTDLLGAGPQGVLFAAAGEGGWHLATVTSEAVDHLRVFDLGNDDTLDLLVARGERLWLYEARSGAEMLLEGRSGGRWSAEPLELPALPAPPADLAFVDFDHEGDLDLLAVGSFGARLLRNDGAAARRGEDGSVVRGAFVDVSTEASLPDGVGLTWCVTEDFDNDQDVDFLLGGPDALILLDSRRAAGFVDIAGEVLSAAEGMARKPVVADLDGDARPDLFVPGAPASLWWQGSDGSFEARNTLLEVPRLADVLELDLDLDGTLDVIWTAGGTQLTGVRALGLDVERPLVHAVRWGHEGPLACGDLDGDLDLDLLYVTAAGVEVLRNEGPVGNAARLRPLGLKDNRRAVGAVVEVRSRELYRRIYWRGAAQLVGCGANEMLDVVRTTWPNGVVQTALDVAPTDQPFLDTPTGSLEQTEALAGSCPFLYSWNGETYEFISDVLGGTPLGLPMAPGLLVPPDHDEFVLVRGDQLAPRDGVLELQFTEELREVTYLDRIRLDVVDHPEGTEIHPEERFTFPPFPEPHVHTVRAPLSPLRAAGSDGVDWTAELAAVDDVHAEPFEPLEEQFLGLATPHWLELEFDPEQVRDAKKLRLLFTGWFFWTDASVNMASARTPGVEFVPPILQILGADGEWVASGPPVGFPAGKSKTMVIDVSEILDRENPRLRVFTTLRLYWDCIRLAVDADDAQLRITELEPTSAVLWPRGFSRPIETGRSDLPERFEWGVLTEHRSWNQHPGLYTRYGETLPLLQTIDDRFAILGSGDALAVRFDAGQLPPLEAGWTRDYLVLLDGWAKDRDPNTIEALEVEPLPFHGMSGYPYGAGERFPDTPEHRAWREEWNTREARTWIPPLSPRREAEWALQAPGG